MDELAWFAEVQKQNFSTKLKTIDQFRISEFPLI